MSLYRFHELNGVALGGDLYRITHGGSRYKPMLEHVARRRGRRRAVVTVRRAGRAAPPVLTPGQIEKICSACAWFDPAAGSWQGRVRDRLLWSLLAESGLRLGEALGLQHRDWHTGRGDTAFVEVVPREGNPHGARVKGGHYRRVFVSDELDRLYGEYLWQLCEAGADVAVPDLDQAPVFVNLAGGAVSRRGGPKACMTWWTGCAATWPARFPQRGRRIGCGIRTPRHCCCLGFRCTWCPAGSGTPTCRPRCSCMRMSPTTLTCRRPRGGRRSPPAGG